MVSFRGIFSTFSNSFIKYIVLFKKCYKTMFLIVVLLSATGYYPMDKVYVSGKLEIFTFYENN